MHPIASLQRARFKLVSLPTLFVLLITSAHSLRAKDSSEYKPPGQMYTMTAHFAWCGEAKAAAERLKRYEKFWELQAPEQSHGYDDSLHVRTVRRCAYRLANLYAELGRTKDCQKMLKWLEKEDDTLDVNKG
jgi:hypothetical protein